MQVSLTAINVRAVQQQIAGLENIEQVIDEPVRLWTESFVQRRLAGTNNYAPEIAPGVWAANTTPRQKAAFFAKLRNGGWSRRTGALGNAWTVERTGPAAYKIRNPQPYAGWIVGNAIGLQQTRWARQYWWRYRERFNEDLPDLDQEIHRAISNYLRSGPWRL